MTRGSGNSGSRKNLSELISKVGMVIGWIRLVESILYEVNSPEVELMHNLTM